MASHKRVLLQFVVSWNLYQSLIQQIASKSEHFWYFLDVYILFLMLNCDWVCPHVCVGG